MPSGEDRLIGRYFKPLATAPGALGLTDDAASFAPPEGHDLVLTTDAIVSGVHFLPDDPTETVARKALPPISVNGEVGITESSTCVSPRKR